MLGVILSFVILELGMRLSGGIFLSLQGIQQATSIKPNETYRILCLGGSTTAGGQNAYPAQLETILNKRMVGRRIRVINKGVPAITTSGILKDLERNLTHYKPHMVVAMMGINDAWDPLQMAPANEHPWIRKIHSWRMYKLFKYLLLSCNKFKNNHAPIPLKHVVSQPAGKTWDIDIRALSAQDFLKKISEKDALDKDIYLEAAKYHYYHGQFDDAIMILNAACRHFPDFHYAYSLLGSFYIEHKQYNLALPELQTAIAISPTSEWHYILLAQAYWSMGDYPQAERTLQGLLSVNQTCDRAYGMLAHIYREQGLEDLSRKYERQARALRTEYYLPKTKANYLHLRNILRAQGIILVCVQYPLRSIAPLKKIFDDTTGIIFVDNENNFKDALKRAPYTQYFIDAFAGDFGHCSVEGNRLLAENMARVIEQYLRQNVLATWR